MWMGWWYPDCGDYEHTEGGPEPTPLGKGVVEVEVELGKLTLCGGAEVLETFGDRRVTSLDPTLRQGE